MKKYEFYIIIIALSTLLLLIPVKNLYYEKAILINVSEQFKSPSLKYPLGTDELGRNLLFRNIVALSNTARVILLTLLLILPISTLIGSLAGFSENKIFKHIAENLFNLTWSIPGIPLFIAVLTYFPKNLISISIAIASITWVPIARTIRFTIESEKNKPYILALKAFGFPKSKIIFTLIFNLKTPITISIISTMLDIFTAESTLSFLGLGIQPPEPSLGSMIYYSLNFIPQAPWIIIPPLTITAFIIIFLISSLNKIRGYYGYTI